MKEIDLMAWGRKQTRRGKELREEDDNDEEESITSDRQQKMKHEGEEMVKRRMKQNKGKEWKERGEMGGM